MFQICYKMNPIVDHDETTFNEKVLVDFHYFIQSAIEKKLPWNTLVHFLTDLAPTLEKSRQVIKILVQELEKWVLKEDIGENNVTEVLDMELAEHIQDDDQNSLASSEMSDSEDENLKDTMEVINDDQEIGVDQLEHNLNLLEKKEILGEEDVLVDKVGRQFYEFVGDHNEGINKYDIPKGAQIVSTDEIEKNDDALKQIESDNKDIEEIGENDIGDQFYEFVGGPGETKENHKNSKETIKSMGAAEKVSLDELTESKISHLVQEEKKKFNCSVCNKAISKKRNLKKHERIHTRQKPYKCNDCGKSFTLKTSWKRHEIVHTGEKSFECKTCLKRFKYPSDLKRHEIVHTGGDKPFHCTICSNRFNYQNDLKRHEKRIHEEEKPHKCFACNKSFGHKYELNSHAKTHTGEKSFHCKYCEKSFSRSESLKGHERIHTKEKPYMCNDCGKSFTLQGALKRHVMLHKAERQYQCKTCSKSFASNAHLKRHEIIHTEERPFQCHTCKKCFNLRDGLKRHEIIHKEEKPHKCLTCNKTFAYKYHLKTHEIIHTGEKPFVCKNCGKCFSRLDKLKVHERKHT